MGPLLLALAGAPIAIHLSAPKATYASGDEVIFRALVKNNTKETIEMVAERDGMNWKRKAPFCILEAKQANGTWDPLLMKGVGRCGNSNPLDASDFVEIEKGKSGDILQGMPWSKYEVKECLRKPGTYTIRLRYDSTPVFEAWLGGPLMPDKEAEQKRNLKSHYDKTPKGVFLSNEVTIKIQ
ncbi:MAG: hypothetical protein JST51_06235 [Armatimonadetes bacterium]|nr:hypothetical protein [Armatimonadota bacterium]